MFYANLGVANDKVGFYVMHKHLIIGTKLLANEFEMDTSSKSNPLLTIGMS